MTNTISPSKLYRIYFCPFSGDPNATTVDVPNVHAERGTSLHSVLESLLNGRTPSPDVLEKLSTADITKAHQHHDTLIKHLSKIFGDEKFSIHTELKVSAEWDEKKWGSSSLRGTIDVVATSLTKVVVVDYKAGGTPTQLSGLFQLNTYLEMYLFGNKDVVKGKETRAYIFQPDVRVGAKFYEVGKDDSSCQDVHNAVLKGVKTAYRGSAYKDYPYLATANRLWEVVNESTDLKPLSEQVSSVCGFCNIYDCRHSSAKTRLAKYEKDRRKQSRTDQQDTKSLCQALLAIKKKESSLKTSLTVVEKERKIIQKSIEGWIASTSLSEVNGVANAEGVVVSTMVKLKWAAGVDIKEQVRHHPHGNVTIPSGDLATMLKEQGKLEVKSKTFVFKVRKVKKEI